MLVGLAVVLLALTSSMALYYRGQARHFERDRNWALAQIAKTANEHLESETDLVEPVVDPPPVPVAETNRNMEQDPAAQTGEAAPAVAVAIQRFPDGPRSRRGGTNWLENLRATDPQRYEEMQKRRAEALQRVQNAWDQSADYFMNRDVSRMSEQELDEYSRMITLLNETRALTSQLQTGVPPEQRREVMSTLHSNMMALVPLLDSERNKEYYDLALAMGQSEAQAAALVGYINQIGSNTSVRNIFPDLGRGGFRDGGRGRGGPPRGN